MFTDFSVYSRQAKTIRSLGMVTIDQGMRSDPCAPKCETDSATGEQFCPSPQPPCAAFKNADGSWTEIRGKTSEEIERAYDQLTRDGVIGTAKADYSSNRDYNTPVANRINLGEAGLESVVLRQVSDQSPKKGGGSSGGGSSGGGGGGGGGSYPNPSPDPTAPTDFSKTGEGTTTPPEISAPSSSTGQGTFDSSMINMYDGDNPVNSSTGQGNPYASQISGQDYGNPSGYKDGAAGYTSEDLIMGTSIFGGIEIVGGIGSPIKGTTMDTNFALQPTPAYTGQSGSSRATYPAVGRTTPSTSSGASAWVTDYNSIGFMNNDTIRGGSYYAPSGGLVSTAQGTNPATQVGIAYPSQQTNYDTFSNVTGAGNQVYMGGSPSFNEATGQYTNVTSNPIANPNTLPTMLSEYDLFGNVGASSGLFLDTPTIKQDAVGTTAAVDTAEVAEPAQGGGLGWVTIGLIALKALSVI